MRRTATVDKMIYSKAQDQRPSFEVLNAVILTIMCKCIFLHLHIHKDRNDSSENTESHELDSECPNVSITI